MTRKRFLTILLAGLLAGIAGLPAQARRDERDDDRREKRKNDRRQDSPSRPSRDAAPPRDGLSLDEAVARVRRETGGRVLSAEADGKRGGSSYRIKVLLPNGSVRVYHVDAHRGRTD